MPPTVDWTRTCIGCQYCCTYVSLPIDAPRTDADFDHVRWYLAHRNIHIYIDHDGDWYFLVNNVCENLTPTGCAIYEKRFDICRDYDAAACEMTTGEPAEKVLFRTVEDFDRWMAHNRDRLAARRRPGDSPTSRTIRGHLTRD
jgi:Fe-S-cluster containining protein